MATKQDLKAKALKELEEEQKQYKKQQEAKQSAAEANKEAKQSTAEANKEAKQSTAKANKEADLIGAKDAAKLNKTKSTGTVGTKHNLNDSMAKRLNAEKGLEIIENRKAEKAAEQEAKKKTEAFANKEADLPGYKPGQTMSREEMFRLLKLDTEEAEEELSEKRAEYTAAGGGTTGAVRNGMKLGNPQKTVVRDYEGFKAREEEIANRERDILLANQLQKQAGYIEDQDSSEKKALGREGYAAWEKMKAEQGKKGENIFTQMINAGFNAPDITLPTAGFQQAVKAHKEDTSENEPNDEWTYEQKRTFGYYWGQGDYEKAAEYAREVNNAIRAGEKEKALKETTEFGMNNKLLADVASVPGSMLRGAGFLDDLAQYAAQGYITENSMPLPGEMIDAYRGTRGEMLNIEHGTLGENAGILEGKGLGDLYQIGMSTADSLFAAYTGGKPGALVSAFGSSATSAVDDALARGATAEQALGYGALSGATELLPEYMSVDSLLKILPSGGAKMLADIGRQGLTEGAEGLITSLSSALADEAVMGELSKYNIEVNNLMLSGLSREEAEKIAQNSVNEEIILDTIGEALGGLGSGGFAVSIQNFTAGKKNAPVPFEGTAQPGTEAAMVADKITEIENRPISEADKAAKMEEVIEAVEEAGTEEGLYKEAAKSAEYHKKRAEDFEEAVTVGKKLGITVEFDENLAANGVHTADGRIIINPNTENPVLQVLIHELTHDIETSGLYKQLSGNILGFVEEQGISLDSMRQMVKADYSEAGIKLSPEQTDAEIVAKFAERYLFTDEKAIQRLCNTEPTLFEKIRYWISDMVIKLRGTAEENFLLEAERLYEKALATRRERTGAGTEQYLIRKDFENEISKWLDGTTPNQRVTSPGYFEIGTTSDVLKSIGVHDGKVYWRKYKIGAILQDHPEISEETIKKVPQILEEPYIVMKSATREDSVVLFGELKAENGNNVMAALLLTPQASGNKIEADFSLLTTAHGDKTDDRVADLINRSEILYLDTNKNRAETWLMQLGVQFPSRQPANSSIGSIFYQDGKVNIKGKKLSEIGGVVKKTANQHSVGRGFDELAESITQEEKQQHIDAAKRYFGTTYSWNETGYITTDGARLDFSGKHEGGRGGYRTVDHRDIVDALGEDYGEGNYSGGLVRFMGEGNIRLSPESGGINLSVMPTQAQLERLSDYISRERGEVVLDIDDLNGNTISSTEYPKHTHANKVIADIKNYFINGVIPEGSESETAQWRYSSGRGFDELAAEAKEAEYEAAVYSGDMETAQKYVDEAAKAAGYNSPLLYHGTRNADFSVFNRNWNFFTDNKEMADSYSPNGDMYEVYLDIKKPFVIDAYGEKWSRIPISDDLKEILDNYGASTFEEDGEWRTTPADIASAILDGIDEGEFDYDGIIIKNVDDTGGYYKNSESNIGTDYIVFDSRKVKSADPVTYDDNGNIIPLSERFNKGEKDIRYSSGRGFDELAGNAKANHGIAEEFSAEITDSARRVIEQMPKKPKNQSTTSQVNPESESTKLADVPQSEKSKRIEKRYQRAVEEGVASVFGVSRSDIKGEIRPIVEEISAKLKAGEKIGKEQIENLYKTAFDAGIITEEFPQYDATRRYIRGTKIYIDQKTRDEFGEDFEFRDFARSNFGNMKFSSDPRDSHLDSFYKSLSEMEPDMFHEDETDPKTQLEEIADFMQQTKKQYYGLAEVYSGKDLSDFEIWAKGELQNYMNEFSEGIDTVRGYERDRQIKATNKAREIDREASFDLAKAAFRNNRVFEAQKAMEKAKANALLKDTDLIVVKRLHEGTLTEADVILQNAGNVEGIIEVYKAEKAYREARAPFDRYKAAYKTALQHDAVNLTELSDEWEDKKIGALYSRETAERNIRDIAGKGGEKIIAEYITPVHEHEAEKTRWIREMNQRVLDLDLGKMNRYERAYAQMIGENASYIAEGKITKHDQAEHDALNERISVLLSEHGNKINKAKCEKAAAGLMEIYEDIRNQWNDERIRRGQEPVGEIENYFPHFTETKPENLLQKIFSWFGIDISSSKLPTDIAGRTADRRPNTKYNPHANRRTSDVTDYDILKGFDGYVRAVGDNIFHTEDIQKLRALSDTIRTKYSSEETEKRIEEIRNRNDLSEEDKEVLIADTFKAMPGAYHLSNFVVWLDEYTNILAGKKSRGDREAEYQMGREIYDVSKAIEGRIASNMIGYNLSTPVMNLVPLFQATADISPVDIVSSVLQTGVAAAKGDSYISDNSDFLTNRFGADTVYKKNYSLFTAENMKDAVAKINDGGAYFMEFVDRIVSEALLRARYQQNLKKGLDKVSAFSESYQWAAGLIADRSLGALPTVFNVKNPVAKALSMFQVEANNQYSYIFKDAGKYKWQDKGVLNTITGQLAFWTAMALCNGLAKELLGRDNVVPDPVGLSAKSLGKIIKGEPVGDVALDAATTAVEQLPFVGGLLGGGRVPISTAIPDIEQAAKLFNPEVSFDKKKQILLDEISKPFSYILLPSGAGQLWKTGKGIKQIAEGGAFGMENDGSEYLKFPQEYDPENLVKTLLFGQYASDAGQNYIDSGFKDKLSVKQTQQMELAENLGISKEEFYNTVRGLKGIRKTEDKQEALYNNEDLSADVKAKLDYVLFGKPTYKATENGYIEPERNYTSAKEFYRSGLSETEKRLDAQGFSKTEIDKIEKAIKDGGSKSDDIKNIAKALGISEQEAFEVYQKRNGTRITENSAEDEERARKAEEFYGMSAERFNTVLNYSKNENAVSDIAAALGIGEEEAKILLDRVTKYEYTKADLEEERIAQLETAGEWYDVEERGYFIARNAIKSAKGKKDQYGNTVSGSKKAEAIEEISRQLNVDEEEAKIYYLAANGDLALSRKDLSSAKQKDLEEALKHGWTERQFLDAVNIIKISGATRKSDIINALVSFGAPYEMAVGYYNLSENYDYFKRS